jgi:hypothetical protein
VERRCRSAGRVSGTNVLHCMLRQMWWRFAVLIACDCFGERRTQVDRRCRSAGRVSGLSVWFDVGQEEAFVAGHTCLNTKMHCIVRGKCLYIWALELGCWLGRLCWCSKLLGSCSSLGEWQAGSAVRLQWSDGHKWSGTADLPAG